MKKFSESTDGMCYPVSNLEAGTQIINTLGDLNYGILDSLASFYNGKYHLISPRYLNSSQIRFMVDTLIKDNTTIIYNKIQIPLFGLRLHFEPAAETVRPIS
jgi:hypothetical protein